MRSFDVWFFLSVLSFVWRLFAIFGGQISRFFCWFVCSLVCLGGSVLGRVCSPAAALFFLFFSSLSLGGSAGAGSFFLAPLPSVCAKLRSWNLRRCRHVLACCALPPSPVLSFPPFSPPFPPRVSGRPPLFPAVSLSVSLSPFSSFLFFLVLSLLSLSFSLFFSLSFSLPLHKET